MRILFLSHRLPCPPHKGEKIRALNILKYLGARYQVHLGSLVDDPTDLDYLEQVRPFVRSVTYVRVRPLLGRLFALKALLGHQSVTTDYFYSRRLQQRIDGLIARENIEAVFCSSSPMAEYVFRSRHAAQLALMPRVMDLIDVDSVKWQDYADASPRWSAWLYRREARCVGELERRILNSFDRALVVSEQEKRMIAPATSERVIAMPNGVDLEFFRPREQQQDGDTGSVLVFTGAMSYRPNIDAMVWFVESILPRVQEAIPGARLVIVGQRPASEIVRLKECRGVDVTGFVPDVREYLAAASVCVAPLRIARGLQNKVLEAMAMGRSVVATRQAFEGIDAEPDRDIVVADGEEAFAQACVDLLLNAKRRADIGRNARLLVERRYAWDRNLKVLDRVMPAAGTA